MCFLGNRLRAFLIGFYPLRHLRPHSLHSHSSCHSFFAWATQFKPSHNCHSLFWPFCRARELLGCREFFTLPHQTRKLYARSFYPLSSFSYTVLARYPLACRFAGLSFIPIALIVPILVVRPRCAVSFVLIAFILATERTRHGVIRPFLSYSYSPRSRSFSSYLSSPRRPFSSYIPLVLATSFALLSLCLHRRIFPRHFASFIVIPPLFPLEFGSSRFHQIFLRSASFAFCTPQALKRSVIHDNDHCNLTRICRTRHARPFSSTLTSLSCLPLNSITFLSSSLRKTSRSGKDSSLMLKAQKKLLMISSRRAQNQWHVPLHQRPRRRLHSRRGGRKI